MPWPDKDFGRPVVRQGGNLFPRGASLPPALAPRARAPPKLEVDRVGTPGFAFDQVTSWDPIAPPPSLPPVRPLQAPATLTQMRRSPHAGAQQLPARAHSAPPRAYHATEMAV